MSGGRVAMDLVRVEQNLLRTELAFMPHDTGHLVLDVAVLGLVQADAEAVGELGVAPHGRRPVLLVADLALVFTAVAKVITVDAGALNLLTVEVFHSAEYFLVGKHL